MPISPCDGIAPKAIFEASVVNKNGFVQSGYLRTSVDISLSLKVSKAVWHSLVQLNDALFFDRLFKGLYCLFAKFWINLL